MRKRVAILVTAVALGFGLIAVGTLSADEGAWQAGAARVDITPDEPLPMAGYRSRGNRPFQRVAQPLFARALVLRDGSGEPAVLVTLDLVGIPRAFGQRLAEACAQRYGVPTERFMVVCSHTHTGPAVYDRFAYLLGATEAQLQAIRRYLDRVFDRVMTAIGKALGETEPVSLAYGESTAGFAMNRRARRDGRVVLGVNRKGPVDRSVPVLWVRDGAGQPLAVVFGYACHCTTLTGESFEISGDFAGYAAETLEERFPGVTALFVTGCGGDANPYPRGNLALAKQHGASLARAVEATLSRRLKPVRGPLRAVRRTVPLRFAPGPSLEEFRRRAQGDPARYATRHARWILEVARRHGGQLPKEYPYTIQAWRFDEDLVMVALAGEVVVEYALNTKRRYGTQQQPVWVIAYANDVFAYIPTARMLEEGGYEPIGSMQSWGWHSIWAKDVEQRVLRGIAAALHELGAAPPDEKGNSR